MPVFKNLFKSFFAASVGRVQGVRMFRSHHRGTGLRIRKGETLNAAVFALAYARSCAYNRHLDHQKPIDLSLKFQ